MKDQHTKITGYRDLTQAEINAMNRIKELSVQVGAMCDALRTTSEVEADQRWVSIGATQLQQGFMALTRSIAKPTTF